MSAAKNLTLVPAARKPFDIDAALPTQGVPAYYMRSLTWAQARADWQQAIKLEELHDAVIPSLHELSVDPRDGALTRGAGGLAYTPHAWSQLLSLMRAGAPSGLAAVTRWLKPGTRCLAWRDIVVASKRPRTDEGVLRTFREPATGLRALRAVVSGRHSLEAYDDANIIAVLDEMDAASRADNTATLMRINTAFVARRWDVTYGNFTMAAAEGAALGFTLRNSETGMASLGFSGHVYIETLDARVMMPANVSHDVSVRIAARAKATTRRHTMPRYDSRTGDELSKEARAAIAADRIEADVEVALASAAVLADAWLTAKMDINPTAIALAKASAGDETAAAALKDLLLENGCGLANDASAVAELVTIMADDTRLRALPAGSAAYMASALAVLAQGSDRSWEDALLLQAMAGRFILEGWHK